MTSNKQQLQTSTIWANLSRLDDDLVAIFGADRYFDITLVGSSALILLGVVSPNRLTTDIDILEAPSEIVEYFQTYQISTLVDTFLYSCPESWRKRRQQLPFDGSSLTIYTMSLEDLVILKLQAYRKRDVADLKDIVQSARLDWTLLDHIISDPLEVRISLSSEDEWITFHERYEWLKREKNK
jgi:hypothetical protein